MRETVMKLSSEDSGIRRPRSETKERQHPHAGQDDISPPGVVPGNIARLGLAQRSGTSPRFPSRMLRTPRAVKVAAVTRRVAREWPPSVVVADSERPTAVWRHHEPRAQRRP